MRRLLFATLLLIATTPAAADPLPKLFDRLELGDRYSSAINEVTKAGAKILRRTTDERFVADVCRAGDTACEKKNRYVRSVRATLGRTIYRLQFTSPPSGHRVYRVLVVAGLPDGLSEAAFKDRVSEAVRAKPTIRSSVLTWVLNDEGHLLRLTFVGRRYAAERYDPGRERDDRIAKDRLRRGRR